MSRPDLEPLVIIGIGGGLEQWRVVKSGTGLPRTHVLDYDREGQFGAELAVFAEEIMDAMAALAEFRHTKDASIIKSMAESVEEYRELAMSGAPAGRYE